MIEGGGLGVFRPEEVGPMRVQVPNGVVDIAVADEAEAVARREAVPARTSRDRCTTGRAPTSGCCARVIPENRLRVYDVRKRDRDARRHRTRCSSCAAASASAW